MTQKNDNKKKYDDTDLEWYGLTEKGIENIKNEEDEIGDVEHNVLFKAFKIKEFFDYQWINVSVDDILPLIIKWKQVNEQICNKIQIES